MPELPEVETTRRGLQVSILQRPIARVLLRAPRLRLPMPKPMPAHLKGHHFTAIHRRAKYLLLETDHHHTALIHLGMSGRLLVAPQRPPEKHDHLIIEFHDGGSLIFNDPRRFGVLLYGESEKLRAHKLLAGLGPEPLEATLTATYLARTAQGKKTNLKSLLLDQRVVAGLGNIYVSEALFWAGLDPRRSAESLTIAEIKRLIPAIRKVLNAAIKAGGSSLRDYKKTDGALGYFQNNFAVYDRKAQPCPHCDCELKKTGGVQHFVQAGRSTYWCPQRQG